MQGKESENNRLKQVVDDYFRSWGLNRLVGKAEVKFSNRLRVSLGRVRLDTYEIRLNPVLLISDVLLLDEVLCHECAHIAVYECYGEGMRPHGPEWVRYMEIAGYQPRVRIQVSTKTKQMMDSRHSRYEHICPVCQTNRIANKPMQKWRCSVCIDAGLTGKLDIIQVEK